MSAHRNLRIYLTAPLVFICLSASAGNFDAGEQDTLDQKPLTAYLDTDSPISIYFDYEMDYSGIGPHYFSRAWSQGLWGTRVTMKQIDVVQNLKYNLENAELKCELADALAVQAFEDLADVIIEIKPNLYFVSGDSVLQKGSQKVNVLPSAWHKLLTRYAVNTTKQTEGALCRENRGRSGTQL